MLTRATSTGRIWASPIGTTARSSARTSTGSIARPSFPRARRSRRSSSISIVRTASSTGAIVRGCGSCARTYGSGIETLVDSSRGDTRPGPDPTKWCVGITVDAERGHVYWTQKGPDNAEQGRIFRAGIDIPKGEGPSDRTDIEVLFDHLPEPIDLELEAGERLLYWTDRGDPPRGNTVNRASVDTAHTQDRAPDILVTHLMEGIGLALDPRTDRMFMTDLAGSIYCARLDGSEKRAFLQAQGNLTGIAYAEIPTER